MADHGWITLSDHAGKKINVNVEQITHFYNNYVWVSGSVTIECRELGGQIAQMIREAGKKPDPETAQAAEPKAPFDTIVKDHLDIEPVEGH